MPLFAAFCALMPMLFIRFHYLFSLFLHWCHWLFRHFLSSLADADTFHYAFMLFIFAFHWLLIRRYAFTPCYRLMPLPPIGRRRQLRCRHYACLRFVLITESFAYHLASWGLFHFFTITPLIFFMILICHYFMMFTASIWISHWYQLLTACQYLIDDIYHFVTCRSFHCCHWHWITYQTDYCHTCRDIISLIWLSLSVPDYFIIMPTDWYCFIAIDGEFITGHDYVTSLLLDYRPIQ